MHESNKKQIADLLQKYVAQYPSQAKAADTLKGTSEPTIINILKGRWDGISDEMWRKIAKQVGFSNKGTWSIVNTSALRDLTILLDNAKEYSNVFAVTAPSGTGKTQAAVLYKSKNQNTFHVVCSEYYNRKVFLSKILESMGKDNTGTVSEMMDMIISQILKLESPLIILDEADKLNDQVLHFFITLYNMLEGNCGIVLMATEYLAKRINRGVKLRRKGHEEIFSRLGRKFIVLHKATETEIKNICELNGITDPAQIMGIYNECEHDLRRVERAIHKLKMVA